MSKRMKTAAELVALLNAELRKHEACSGVSVDGITPLAGEPVTYTWTATAAVRLLQQRYDLLSEDDL